MIDWLFTLEGGYIYGGIFALLMGGAFGLPIPEDLPMLLGGVLLHRGHAELLQMFITCYTGVVLGDVVLFSIGRKIGKSARKRGWFENRISPALIEKTKRTIEKRSFIAILFARHLFYLRTVTFLACGAMRMSYPRFILADMFAALISATLMLSLGFMFSDSYEAILITFKQTKLILLFVTLLLAIGFWFYCIKKRRTDP